MANEALLFANIEGHIYDHVEGFRTKYFPGSPKLEQSVAYVAKAQASIPRVPIQKFILDLFRNLHELPISQRAFDLPFDQGIEGFPSIVLLDSNGPNSSQRLNDWANILAFGEVGASSADQQVESIHRLCEHAHNIFMHQPIRRFLHCFQISGSSMKSWVFDRSGLYGSDPFDINHDTSRFNAVLAGYATMTDHDLGLNTFVHEDTLGSHVLLHGEKFYLQKQAIVSPRAMNCYGPTCYRARRAKSERWECVVKFKWRGPYDRTEEDLLNICKEKNVWGVVRLEDHRELDSISNIREALHFTNSRKLVKSEHGVSTWQFSALLGSGSAEVFFEDRVLSYLLLSPLGRSIRKFGSILELLEAFRDIIKGHQSLYQDGRILHRDISIDNIMITDLRSAGDPYGFLIDLDLAKLLDSSPSGKREVIGSKRFMAIGVLLAQPHTYRHDLESIFYCFIWIAVVHDHLALPKSSMLNGWSTGSFEECARRKRDDMTDDRFLSIIAEFSTEFAPLEKLVQRLRLVLFPKPDESSLEGSNVDEDDPKKTYEEIIREFDGEIVLWQTTVKGQTLRRQDRRQIGEDGAKSDE